MLSVPTSHTIWCRGMYEHPHIWYRVKLVNNTFVSSYNALFKSFYTYGNVVEYQGSHPPSHTDEPICLRGKIAGMLWQGST